ncbi:hypothetical protein CLV63_12357 [Murinocardiopsis flavida]|uniref:Uncharacterized protein n=1 Tax=Murinocardiopsis flavida TaxID=645275 RepID=A0A2P8CZ23_9ACTN|nr:hypothetical protein CLV63_12357 [Murinocardiopsis flavida]
MPSAVRPQQHDPAAAHEPGTHRAADPAHRLRCRLCLIPGRPRRTAPVPAAQPGRPATR